VTPKREDQEKHPFPRNVQRNYSKKPFTRRTEKGGAEQRHQHRGTLAFLPNICLVKKKNPHKEKNRNSKKSPTTNSATKSKKSEWHLARSQRACLSHEQRHAAREGREKKK